MLSPYVRLTAKQVKIAVPRKLMEQVLLSAKKMVSYVGAINVEIQVVGSASTAE